ncbi:hypothetical protein ARMGADRAFT_1137345 [Armillaria gallica]|uniref:Uncharacterized protein n=1 Tax=Armillaria gallica TaxID=47427 RepID=A0A2H3D2Z3_ARMGA|nr:hypothetical protein ARMGADRAFT_1137345 [Armillaria gallica]
MMLFSARLYDNEGKRWCCHYRAVSSYLGCRMHGIERGVESDNFETPGLWDDNGRTSTNGIVAMTKLECNRANELKQTANNVDYHINSWRDRGAGSRLAAGVRSMGGVRMVSMMTRQDLLLTLASCDLSSPPSWPTMRHRRTWCYPVFIPRPSKYGTIPVRQRYR